MLRLERHEQVISWRRSVPAGRTVGFVPTMGALHDGHASLVRRAAAECDLALASVFVNPLQFDDPEDFRRYPRTVEEDCDLLAGSGAQAVYLPLPADVYPEPRTELVEPGAAARAYEGEFRPGHFAGVLTVVKRLFERVRPHKAYFGEKDAQQLFLVREMTRKLGLPVEVVPCPTVRDPDGLAMSSRNRRLSPEERRRGLTLYQALLAARRRYGAGERDPGRLQEAMISVYRAGGVRPEYAAVVDDRDFLAARAERPGPWRAVTAARIGATRLIDNLLLGEE